VPQGSVLGPLLFVLFINDITDILEPNLKLKLFADDVKLYDSVLDATYACDDFRAALDRLLVWSKTWQLPISALKCSVRFFGRFKPNSSFCLGETALPVMDLVNDLGVCIDSKLKFDHHIHAIVNKAHSKAGLIRRCFLTRDHSVLVKAFNTYVRPALEYASVVWSPTYTGLVDAVESVQRRFTKRLFGLYHLSYAERLTVLGLRSLQYRRLVFDLHMCYKILHGLIEINLEDFFMFGNRITRGHDFKLVQQHARINSRNHFFAVRVVRVWNDLPCLVANASSLSIFKKRLESLDLPAYLD